MGYEGELVCPIADLKGLHLDHDLLEPKPTSGVEVRFKASLKNQISDLFQGVDPCDCGGWCAKPEIHRVRKCSLKLSGRN